MMSCSLTGTDEHGQKIEIKVLPRRGVTPKEYVDNIVAWIPGTCGNCSISPTIRFIRTTDDYPCKSAYKRSLEHFTTREKFTKEPMRAGTAPHVNLSGQKLS